MIQLINTLFRLYEMIIVARVIISWVPFNRDNPIIQWIFRLSEPLLDPIRRILPTGSIGIDFSPFLLLLALSLVRKLLISTLFSF